MASRLADLLDAVWRVVRDAGALLRVCRFAALGVALYTVAVFSAQGANTVLAFLDHPWLVYLATSYFALQTWQWSRLMVSYRYQPIDRRDIDDQAVARSLQGLDRRVARLDERAQRAVAEGERARVTARLQAARRARANLQAELAVLVRRNEHLQHPVATACLRGVMLWLPRLLGVAVFFVTALSLFLAARRYGGLLGPNAGRLLYGGWVLLAGGLVFGLLLTARRRGTNALARALGGDGWVASAQRLKADWHWHRFGDLPRSARGWLLGWGVVALAGFGLAVLAPERFESLGGLWALVLPLSFWAMAGTAVLWWLDYRRVPVLTLLLFWGSIWSSRSDRHPVRLLEPDAQSGATASTLAASRPPLSELLESFQQLERPAQTPVIVATAGGGIRAAYWTALVLAELDERGGPAFRSNLLALSAVSGGGLGAAAYVAAAASGCCSRGLKGRLDAFLAHDFLAPTVATLLAGDVLNSLSPLRLVDDRAVMLEVAWELGWAEAFPENPDAFAQGLHSLRWPDAAWTPALFINGTSVQTGQRIVTSRFDVTRQLGEALDYFALTASREIALSTAVHNGARFPYVSPAGTFVDAGDVPRGQIVDGGYFENFGADTARGLLQALCGSGACAEQGGSLRPIVVQISSDPQLPRASPAPAERASLSTQVFAPWEAYAQTRDARGSEAVFELEALTRRYGGAFAHIRLCGVESGGDAPLGWYLSAAAREAFATQLSESDASAESCRGQNRSSLAEMIAVLRARGAAIQPAGL